MNDIEIIAVFNPFGDRPAWNVQINCEEEKFQGAGWVESRTFYTELEAKIAALVCESMISDKNQNLKNIDFSINKWRTLTRSMFYLLDTPNKDKDF